MSSRPRLNLDWLGVVPFLLFAIAFLLIPGLNIVLNSFRNTDGTFTLENIYKLFQPAIFDSFSVTLRISLTSAVVGGILGFLLAYALVLGGAPTWLRSLFMTFSGVASNFAGVPLAFAFLSTLGRLGMVTVLLKSIGLDLYANGFNLYSFWGLVLTYTYFQLPLALLVLAPPLEGLKKQWREAAESLGASNAQYWLNIALPILLPAILSIFILLFGNAFGAYATAYALTGGQIALVPLVIARQISGDVLNDQGFGSALAFGMIVVMAISITLYSWLQNRTARWLK
jgi:putative spermidine/putrescine transport system permease protein